MGREEERIWKKLEGMKGWDKDVLPEISKNIFLKHSTKMKGAKKLMNILNTDIYYPQVAQKTSHTQTHTHDLRGGLRKNQGGMKGK